MKYIILITLIVIFILAGISSNSEETSITETKTEFSNVNYIQAPHYDFIYSINNGLKVQEADFCKNIVGDSMRPTLFADNIVCYKKYKPSMEGELKEGMIILFEDNKGGQTTHRIKTLYRERIITQGDNTDRSEKTDYDDVRGIAVAILLK